MFALTAFLVAVVGFSPTGLCASEHDIVSKWKSYGGDMALAASASVMVYCSCGPYPSHQAMCNITIAAQFYLQDEPNCLPICGGPLECVYCRGSPRCSCGSYELSTYRLCQTGNRATLCSTTECNTLGTFCSCEIVIYPERTTTTSPQNALNENDDGSSTFHHGLLTGLGVGGSILLTVVLAIVILVFVLYRRRQVARSGWSARLGTATAQPVPSNQSRMKGINNPTYEQGQGGDREPTVVVTRRSSVPVPYPMPSEGTYLYPYAPRLATNSRQDISSVPQPPSPHMPSVYQEISLREGDQPPTYEASEGTNRRVEQAGCTGVERRQPVYMELVRPSDRSLPRPPVDTYMY